jgi:glyoxylase-like metal-dependent hydrolase (beta-lactamase superfamily II)
MKKAVFLLALLISAIGCKNPEKKEVKKIEETKPFVKLYVFDGGSVGANNLNLFAQGETYKGESKKLADAFYVVKHEKGVLIWDTGLPEGLVGQDPYTTPDGAFTISRKDSIINQLKTIDLTPEDVNMIAFSHIHFDHTGAANNFSKAIWLVQQSELDFANGEAIKTNGFYAPASFANLKNTKALNGDYDVFGDESVIIKSMPGHTAGHQVLLLNIGLEKPILLSGDMYHFEQNRTNAVVPQFNHDIPQSEKSIKEFEAFAKEKNAAVFIQHSTKDFEKLEKLLNSL